MATFVIDAKSDVVIKAPDKYSGWITLAQQYLAYESAQPPEAQLPLPTLVNVNSALVALQTAVAAAADGEHNRAIAGNRFNELMASVKGKLSWALNGRSRQFHQSLYLLEAWGVDTVNGPAGARVEFPSFQADWLALLDAYIAKEESLPPAEQWADPPLSEMETLREQVQINKQEREQYKLQRMNNIVKRDQRLATLKMLLDQALHNLIIEKYSGVVDMELGFWGFNVQHRAATGSGSNGTTPEETAVTDPVETDPIPGG